jgi:hypothetical protein
MHPPATDWFYARQSSGTASPSLQREGPVSERRLRELAQDGWIGPEDLVWRPGLPDWMAAREVPGLFSRPLGRSLLNAIDRAAVGLADSVQLLRSRLPGQKDDAVDVAPDREAAEAPPGPPPWIERVPPRYLLAVLGGMTALLGITFAAIAPSQLARGLIAGGVAMLTFGLHQEIGWLTLAVATALVEAFSVVLELIREFRELRAEAAAEAAADRRGLPDSQAAGGVPQDSLDAPDRRPPPPLAYAGGSTISSYENESHGRVLVIREPPTKRWSRWVAGLLSLCVPGLGQCYKGEFAAGVVWFFFVSAGYAALFVPGFLLHIGCVLTALSGNPWTEGRTEVIRG